jgi:hypothetical protein
MNFKHLLLVLASSLTVGTLALYAHGPNTQFKEAFLREEFLREHLPLARRQLYLHRIPISVTLGQCGLESAYGTSTLAIKANNFFGIKAQPSWKGQSYMHDTNEEENGVNKVVKDKFRQYANVEESYNDRSYFLRSSSHYIHLFELATTDYKGWAYGLKKAGYATKSDYAEILINVIETNQFHQYDELVAVAAISINQLTTTKNANINQDKPQITLSQVEILTRIERISDASQTEQQNLKTEIGDLQIQIFNLQKANNNEINDRNKKDEQIQELYRRIDELTFVMQQQAQHIKNLEDCLRDLELQQQVIFNADPLRNQFTNTGQLRQQLEIFPINPVNAEKIFYVGAKKAVNLQPNQTLFEIATKHKIEYRDLLAYNELTAEIANNIEKFHPNMYVFIEPKANSAGAVDIKHTVRAGETMHSISQFYGVKVSKIAQRNQINIEQGEEPAVGEYIFINMKATQKPAISSKADASVPFGSGGTAVAPK